MLLRGVIPIAFTLLALIPEASGAALAQPDTRLEAELRHAAALEAESALREAAALEAKAAEIILNATLAHWARVRKHMKRGSVASASNTVQQKTLMSSDGNDFGCHDRDADAEPVFATERDGVMSNRTCLELQSCCSGCQEYVRVQQKCPVMCGLCDAPDVAGVSPPPPLPLSPSPDVPPPSPPPIGDKVCEKLCYSEAMQYGQPPPTWSTKCRWTTGSAFYTCSGCPECSHVDYGRVAREALTHFAREATERSAARRIAAATAFAAVPPP